MTTAAFIGFGGDILGHSIAEPAPRNGIRHALRAVNGTAKNEDRHIVAKINLDIALKTGSGLVPNKLVLQIAKKRGTPRDVQNVTDVNFQMTLIIEEALVAIRLGKLAKIGSDSYVEETKRLQMQSIT